MEKPPVGGRVGGGAPIAFHNLAIEIDEDHRFRGEIGIVDSAGLDGENAGVRIEHADIAEGEVYQAGGRELRGLTLRRADERAMCEGPQ